MLNGYPPEYAGILKETENPTFTPNDKNSIFEAITKGLNLSQSNLGRDNRKYALENWNTNLISNKFISLYKGSTK